MYDNTMNGSQDPEGNKNGGINAQNGPQKQRLAQSFGTAQDPNMGMPSQMPFATSNPGQKSNKESTQFPPKTYG